MFKLPEPVPIFLILHYIFYYLYSYMWKEVRVTIFQVTKLFVYFDFEKKEKQLYRNSLNYRKLNLSHNSSWSRMQCSARTCTPNIRDMLRLLRRMRDFARVVLGVLIALLLSQYPLRWVSIMGKRRFKTRWLKKKSETERKKESEIKRKSPRQKRTKVRRLGAARGVPSQFRHIRWSEKGAET